MSTKYKFGYRLTNLLTILSFAYNNYFVDFLHFKIRYKINNKKKYIQTNCFYILLLIEIYKFINLNKIIYTC